jgi:hypothetical protein
MKSDRTYSVKELAEALDVAQVTIRQNWMKRGLAPIDTTRPFLFYGADVIAFLKTQKAERRRPCGPGQMFCLSCKAPRAPRSGSVTFRTTSSISFLMSGWCSVCGRPLHQRGALQYFDEVARGLTVISAEAASTLQGTKATPLEMAVRVKAA